MNAHSPLSEFARKIGTALILGALAANSHGGSTQLATEPFTSSGSLKALPNVMFVLDDSGSMKGDFLPDWAAATAVLSPTITVFNPPHRFYNNAFNGVAYNPATYYRPPVMYSSTGALDTSTYPSMNGQSAARGGDATATAGSPNWRTVKRDGYGIQNVAPAAVTANLEGNAYSYTTVPGEYCTDEKLRTCTASATPTGIYTFPAKLRWCDTSTNALTSTAEAGTRCQAANIAPTATNITNGVTPYYFARMPAPRTATFTVTSSASAVSSVTVGGLQILSASTGILGDTSLLATATAAKINACTYGLAGGCGVVGYSATSAGAVVTLTAPGTTSATPLVTGGAAASVTAFAAQTSPVTSTITVVSVGAITDITVSGSKILSAATTTPAATTAPVVTGVANTSTTFAGSPNVTATITVTGGGTNTVTSVKIGGNEILRESTGAQSSTSNMATAIRDKINLCTTVIAGACTVGGYSASRSGSVVTITAPKPVINAVWPPVAPFLSTTFSGAPNRATITVTSFASAVTNLTVGGLRILSASTGTTGITSNNLMAQAIVDKINACSAGLSGACTVVGYSATRTNNVVTITAPGDTTAVAAQIAANINACTTAIPVGPPASYCTVTGYSASSNGNVVTIIAPSATTATPVISPAISTTVTAFGYGSAPGYSLFTVITPSVTSYPFPGTASKATGRTDCAGTTCTYEEEMTNYANWYAYYRTRMEMMKTSASIAFSNVDDQFRVGYYSINNGVNGAGTEFLNPSAFDGGQKYLWYTKFLNATAYGATPLRTALATMGRLYAGKLSTVNSVAANDPMQYSCQQNFTILSTDGYWNEAATPTQIDGTTAIGNQDNNDPRPYYDGGTQTLTTSTTWWNDEQFAANTALFEQRTRQQRITTSQLTDSSITTTTWPYQLQTTQLQTRTTPLTKKTYNLISTSYPLIDTTRQLQKNETFIQRTTRPLESRTYTLTKTETPLQVTETKLIATTTPLQQTVTQLIATTTPLQQTVTQLIATTTPLESKTYKLQATTRQLQAMDEVSTDGGDTWHDIAWADVSSCTATGSEEYVSTYVRHRRCQYAAPVVTGGLSSCATATASPGPTNYTVGVARTCVYEAAVTATAVATCTSGSASGSSPYSSYVTCGYTGTAVAAAPADSCTPAGSAGSPYSVLNRVTCALAGTSTTTNATGTCTNYTPPLTSASTKKIVCGYTGTAVAAAAADSCTPQGSAGSPYTVLSRITCALGTPSPTVNATGTCTNYTPPLTSASTSRIVCGYTGTPVVTNPAANCTPAGSGGSPYTVLTRTTCDWNAVVVASPLLTCSPSGSAAGPPYNSYTTCGYGAGVVATGLTSCLQDPPEAGPSYTGGQTVACAYQGSATTTDVTVGTCTTVPQDTTNFAATGVTCSYAAATTPTVGSCTDTPMSTGPVYTVLNSHSCAYVPLGTPTVTNNNAVTCNANRQTASPYTGPAVDCTYSASVSSTLPNQTSCVQKNAQAGPSFTGSGRVNCTYGTTTGWSNVGSGTCTYKNPMTPLGTDATTYVQGVECAYNATPVNTLVDNTCPTTMAAPGESGTTDGTVYSTLQKKVCVAGAFPSVAAAVLTTPTNNCDTTPTSTPAVLGVFTNTATTCTYLPPVTVNAGTTGGGALPCVPVAASTGPAYVTSRTCPVTDTNWGPVTTSPLNTSCVTQGTPEPASPIVFDTATGKIVQCRSSDTTVYNATFPAAVLPAMNPVAVPTCTWTANPTVTDNLATGVQTTCVKPDASVAFPTINMDPVPVNPTTCTPTTTPVAPAYIWTRCNPVTTTATVRGCNDVLPTSPLWETKTCADDGTGTSNTLADVAAYYYKTDLRTPALGNCSGATIPATGLQGVLCSATKPMNNVPITTSDPNPAQHMTTFTLGLGASGYMQYSSTYEADALPPSPHGDFYTVKGTPPNLPDNGIMANPATGTCAWQSTNLCNWPEPVSDQQTTIDDLWHAGVNGHGAYFSATDPKTLSSSINSALAGVAEKGGSGASPTPSTASVKQGDNYFFNSTYKTVEWTGELVRKQINPVTNKESTANDWSAQAKLDSKAWASRAIWTFDSSVATTKLKAFNSTNFANNDYFKSPHISTGPDGLTQFTSASPTIRLSPTDQNNAAGANLVNFLAGDRGNEEAKSVPDNTKYYRYRAHVLGDLVNAQVVYVNKVLYNYADPGYAAYIAAQASRVAMLYASANDGMLHAFRAKGSATTELLVEAAATAVNASELDISNAALATAAAAAVSESEAAVAADTLIGQEIWAYIPTMVMPNLYKLADKDYANRHRYYVDGSPTTGDICSANCSLNSATWKTILVGGLGKGGRGYYALDITDPTSPKALWEFTDGNLGYSFGSPQIGKLKDGTWVVLVSSGYNNIPGEGGVLTGDGVGRLFVLDAFDGTLIRSIPTGVGDTSDPSGLAKLTAQVISPDSDNTIEAVYGGDLLGNLWRFDVNGPDALGANDLGAAGPDAQLLAVLKDGSGNPQPITTKPQVTSIPSTGEKMVIVGTGSYLDSSDATNTNTQSVYAIKDARAAGGSAGTAIFDNPGGMPRLTGTSTAGFVRQIFTEEVCPAGTSPSICCPVGTDPDICKSYNTGPPGELVRTATSNPVDFTTHSGWFFDLITLSERANTDPSLGLGALVINTNVPSVEACEVGGSSYQYGLNYLTGSAIGATSSSPLSKRVVGRLLANELASSPTLLVTSSGKLISLTGLAGGGVSINLPALPPGASISRRTSWRELIRE
jgi:Tfp pilus tip-associated adhesin PilY1